MADFLRPLLARKQVSPKPTCEYHASYVGGSEINALTDNDASHYVYVSHVDESIEDVTESYIKVITTRKCNIWRLTVRSDEEIKSNGQNRFSITPANYEAIHEDNDSVLWSKLVTGLEPGEYTFKVQNVDGGRYEAEWFFEDYEEDIVTFSDTSLIDISRFGELKKYVAAYFPMQYGYFLTDVSNLNTLGIRIASDTGNCYIYKEDDKNYFAANCDGFFTTYGTSYESFSPRDKDGNMRSCAISFDFKADYSEPPQNATGILDFNLCAIGKFVITVRWMSGGAGNLGMLDMANYDSIQTSSSAGYPPVLPLDGQWHSVVVSSNAENETTCVIIDGICKVLVHHSDFNSGPGNMYVEFYCNNRDDANYNTIPKGFRNIIYYDCDIVSSLCGTVTAGGIYDIFKVENSIEHVGAYTPVEMPKISADESSSTLSVNGTKLNDMNDQTSFTFDDTNSIDITLNEKSDIYGYQYTGDTLVITNKDTGDSVQAEPSESGSGWQKLASDVEPGTYEISVIGGGSANLSEIYTAQPGGSLEEFVPFKDRVSNEIHEKLDDHIVRYSVQEYIEEEWEEFPPIQLH